MSYLPGLRTSLVQAARQRYAHAAAPQKPRRRMPRWLSAGGVATAVAVATAIAVAVVALVTLGRSPARTRATSRPAVTRVALRSSANHALERLVLPSGAVISGLVPGTPAELWSPSSHLGIPGSVDVIRIWRLRERPDRVIQFIEAHQPKAWSGGLGIMSESGGEYSNGSSGRPVVTQATAIIAVPVTSGGVWRQLALNAVTLSGGGTALRVDSEAGWLMPRPSSELIPSGVTRIQIEWALRRLREPGSMTLRDPARIKAIVSAFNALPSGTGMCKRAPNGYIRFEFEGPAGSSPLAVAIWTPPCQNLGLTIGGGPRAPLMIGTPISATRAEFYPVLATAFPPRRISSSSTTLHSTKRCASSQHSTPALSPSAPGPAVVLCTSASSSTKHASVP